MPSFETSESVLLDFLGMYRSLVRLLKSLLGPSQPVWVPTVVTVVKRQNRMVSPTVVRSQAAVVKNRVLL
jgi:hypothetical protein